MSLRIVITKTRPNNPDECYIETLHCTSKQDLEEKYKALTQRKQPHVLSIRVEHSDDE